MFNNYFKIAWRNLWKSKTYSAITIFGLAIGLACALLIFIYVRAELSYDQFHKHSGQVYRILTHREINSEPITKINTSMLLAGELIQSIPEVEAAARLGRSWKGAFTYQDKQFQEPNFFIGDTAITNILDIKVLQGDLQKTLSDKTQIALAAPLAKKYFGENDPIGKTITYTFEEAQDFRVGAVYEPMPANSHVHFDLLANAESVPASSTWSYDFIPTYVRLNPLSKASAVNNKLAALTKRVYPKEQIVSHELQPLDQIHLQSHFEGEFEPNGRLQSVLIISGIGLLLLILASINFMNMATANSASRAREVGVRSVFGANRSQLIRQFMMENIGIILFSMLFALVLVKLMVPLYAEFMGDSLLLSMGPIEVLAWMFVLALVLGFLSSIYPSWFMSSYETAKVLSGHTSFNTNPGQLIGVRKILITIQCSASLLLIICMMGMDRQLHFIETKDRGFEEQGVAYIRAPQLPVDYDVFHSALSNIPGVEAVAYAGRIPGSGQDLVHAIVHAEGMSPDQRIEVPTIWASHDFLKVFNIPMKAGRPFSKEFPNDNTESVLINETAARQLWKQDELGKQINIYRRNKPEPALQAKVIGIIKDFHFQSLHQTIRPMIIRLGGYPTYITLRYNPQAKVAVMNEVAKVWKSISPAWPLELNHLQDDVVNLYHQEKKLSEVTKFLTLIAILLACLGLFGLALFSAQRKTKEIGIRKILGASAFGIFRTMIADFTILIVIAMVVASPLALSMINQWLNGFAYRVNIPWWIFAGSGAMMFAIVVLSTGFQLIKASVANPVVSLRHE